jgi:hypothetical protein
MEEPISDLQNKITKLTELVVGMNNGIIEANAKIDSNFDIVVERLTSIESKLKSLEGSTSNEFSSVGSKLDSLHDEIKKIQKVSGYDAQHENMLSILK